MSLDNLILNVKCVTFDKYQSFISDLATNLLTTDIEDKSVLSQYTKQTAREYHYNVLVGSGDGGAYIGFQHNSERYDVIKGCSLKLEVNPNKEKKEQAILAEIFKKHFEGYTIFIRGLDLALDLEIDKNAIIPVSLTGRQQDRHKGTIYFGNRGKHGYLRIYDKKKELEEKQKVEVSVEHLTRIEFCCRLQDGLMLNFFNALELEMDKLYQITVFDDGELQEVDPVTKAILFSYKNGYQDLKDFTRTYKNKVKMALSNMRVVGLDNAFENAKESIEEILLKFIGNKTLSTV